MPAVCRVCGNNVNNQRKAIKCSEKSCQALCHQECLGQDKNAEIWLCRDCSEPSLRDLMREIKALSHMNKDLAMSLNSCHEKIDELNNFIKNQDLKITECMSKVEELSTRCTVLEKENEELKISLKNQEQYTRMNSIEISGIPEVKEENILSTVSHLYKVLNVNFDINNIDCCYRINRRQQTTEPRAIFLRFTSRLKKEQFMSAKKIRKTFCLSDVNVDWVKSIHDSKKPIYINESLTDINRALLFKCREVKKKENIKFLWIKNGKILMRKSENARVFVINSVGDLSDVH